ncbi:MAG TPA: response regulator [Blastocatellia bacterium]|nr:response regulator [Blastocatellia bacterium]
MKQNIILLVEDNPDDEALMLRALGRAEWGGEFVIAHDGVEALDYLFARGRWADRDPRQMPKAVLLDLKLPKIDGLEVLRQLRGDGRTRHLPVIILTSSDEERDLMEGYRLGANSYVSKSVDLAIFSEAVLTVRDYWLRLNLTPEHSGGSVTGDSG